MDALADKGTKPCLSPHLQLDTKYFTSGVFNQPVHKWPVKSASEFLTTELQDLPLLNIDLEFINQTDDYTGSGINLIQLADRLPDIQPPFWKLMARNRWFITSDQQLIS